MRLVNARTDRVIATCVELANTRATRRRGLLGRSGLADGAALAITPCFAVHTVGMRFAIDVVFVDGTGIVKKIVRDLAPWRLAGSASARTVIEFAAGALLPEGVLSVGDRVAVEPTEGEAATRPRFA
jgi:uncharacterized membrane protein (UPF0127 family)